MDIKNVTYSRTFSWGDGEFEKAVIEIELTPTDHPADAFKLAKETIEANRTPLEQANEYVKNKYAEPVLQRGKQKADPVMMRADDKIRAQYQKAHDEGNEQLINRMELIYDINSLQNAS